MENYSCKFDLEKTISSDFRFLWENIANKFEFMKIEIHDKELKKDIYNNLNNYKYNEYIENNEYNEKIDKIIRKNLEEEKKNLKLINSDNFNIVEITNDEIIISNKKFKFGKIKIIKDYSQTNRYFFAFEFSSDKYNFITGIIIYFNSNGTVSHEDTKIFYDTICSYHGLSIIIKYNTSLFYKQVIILGLMHKTEFVSFEISLLDINDNLILKTNKSDNLQIVFNKNEDLYKNDINFKKTYPHLLHIHGRIIDKPYYENIDYYINNNKSIIIDLESLKSLTLNNKNNINLDYYVNEEILDEIKFSEKMKELNINLKYKIDDCFEGYPILCIKCKKLTSKATINFNICNEKCYHYSNSSFGSSYCFNCNIRFSQTQKNWICCNLINYTENRIRICEKIVNIENNYKCNCEKKLDTKIISEVNSEKYPYKKTMNLLELKKN